MSVGITDLRYVWLNGERVLQYNDQQGNALDWHNVLTAQCPHIHGTHYQTQRCVDCGATEPISGWKQAEEAPP